MPKENWANKPYPPNTVNVLHREKIGEGKEKVYIQGHHPELGLPINGWSGPETLVIREERGGTGRIMFDRDPDYQKEKAERQRR